MAGYRIGMNGATPNGENTRHIAAANASIRTFDTMLKGLERRQARPCAAPMGPNAWDDTDLERFANDWAERVRACSVPKSGGQEPHPTAPLPAPSPPPSDEPSASQAPEPDPPAPAWTAEMIADAEAEIATADPPPPPVEGVAPDGSIVVPDNPTPDQEAYMGARIIHNLRDRWADEIDSNEKPTIPRLRPGDRIP
jgi:hypothetical protein